MPASIPYFAYGSNMDLAQMRYRCPGAKILGFGILENYRFLINGRGVATVVPDDKGCVHGVLWSINEKHEQTLDGYEGVDEGWYYKEALEILTSMGDRKQAMLYVGFNKDPGHPRKGYLEKIVGVASFHNFPSEYVRELESWLRGS